MLVLACVGVYANALGNGFHLDDYYRLVDNPGIRDLSRWWRHFVDPTTMASLDRLHQYRPLLPLTLSLNWALHGAEVVGYHVVNLGLLLGAALVLYRLGLELMTGPQARWVAWLAALAFAVHPVSGLMVNYIVARDLGLSTLFIFASMLAYARLRRQGETAVRWAAVLTMVALAMLSKTNAAVLPALVLAFDALIGSQWPAALRSPGRTLLRAGLVALPVVAFFLYTRGVLHFSDWTRVVDTEAVPSRYLLGQLRLHATAYLTHLVWPWDLCLMPEVTAPTSWRDPGVLAGALWFVGSLVWAWRRRRTLPVVAFGVLAYWALLLPEASWIPFHHPRVDYRPATGSGFLLLAIGAEASRWLSTRALGLAGGAFAAYLGTASVLHNRVWRTDETLWAHAVAHGGDAGAHMNYAMALWGKDDALTRKHFETALAKNPRYVLAHIDFGLFLIQKGETADGIAHMHEALRIAPNWAQPHYWWSVTARKLGFRDSLQHALDAARLEPTVDRHRYQAARELVLAGRHAEALDHLVALRDLHAGYEDSDYLEGFALQMTGALERSLVAYGRQSARTPDHRETIFNTGHALMTLDRCGDAIPWFERALALDSQNAVAQLHLGTCRKKATPR